MHSFRNPIFVGGARRWEKFRGCCTLGWKSNAWGAPLCLAAKGISGKRPTSVGGGCLALESTMLSSEVMKHCWRKHTVPAKPLQDGQDSALSAQQSHPWLEGLRWRNGLSGVKWFHYLLVCESWAHWRFVKKSSENTVVTGGNCPLGYRYARLSPGGESLCGLFYFNSRECVNSESLDFISCNFCPNPKKYK